MLNAPVPATATTLPVEDLPRVFPRFGNAGPNTTRVAAAAEKVIETDLFNRGANEPGFERGNRNWPHWGQLIGR